MRVVQAPEKCPLRLVAGEAKRIPRVASGYLAGYYLACPVCGKMNRFPDVTFDGRKVFSERLEDGAVASLTMDESECERCEAKFSIVDNEYVVRDGVGA